MTPCIKDTTQVNNFILDPNEFCTSFDCGSPNSYGDEGSTSTAICPYCIYIYMFTPFLRSLSPPANKAHILQAGAIAVCQCTASRLCQSQDLHEKRYQLICQIRKKLGISKSTHGWMEGRWWTKNHAPQAWRASLKQRDLAALGLHVSGQQSNPSTRQC